MTPQALGAITQSAVSLVVYFLPVILALALRKRRWVAILFIDLFLGWTIIGWVIALVLAFTWRKRPRPSYVWDGVHTVTVRGGGGALPVWVAKCTCGWQSGSYSYEEMQAAANQRPHPLPRQPYYAGPG